MRYKSRKKKQSEYDIKYSNIPKSYNERLEWMYNNFNISDKKAESILRTRESMINSLRYKTISFVLYEIPAGKERPRFRTVSKKDIINNAIKNPSFVHVYSLSASEDKTYMRRLINNNELIELDQLLCTPVYAVFNAYFPIPKSYSQEQIFLSEMGLIRPLSKPDFDNIEKKYADMFNNTIWLDDMLVTDSEVHKFYSILPRIEITLHVLNMVYNKRQYDMMINRKDFNDNMKLSYFGGGNNNEHQRTICSPIKRIKTD